MSLKAFHIVFICLSVLCTFGFALWALMMPGLETLIRGFGWFSGFLAVALVVYGVWFWKKSKLVIT